jgi:hypothetical protein
MVTDVIFCTDGSRVLTIDNVGAVVDWDTREHHRGSANAQ